MLGLVAAMVLATGDGDMPGPWEGPGRFCVYAPIIDLVAGERVQPLGVGIHSARFRWEGPFGALDVHGIGWASKPSGTVRPARTAAGQIVFAPRRDANGYVVAIWNGRNGSAYFRSPARFTAAQLAAIERVSLFDENGPKPENCTFSMVFVWV